MPRTLDSSLDDPARHQTPESFAQAVAYVHRLRDLLSEAEERLRDLLSPGEITALLARPAPPLAITGAPLKLLPAPVEQRFDETEALLHDA